MGVWIETGNNDYMEVTPESHPAWVCGLKPGKYQRKETNQKSHPAWVCGLKQMLTVDRNSLD